MAKAANVNGIALSLATAGGILVYAGLRGESPLDSLRGILTGKPSPIPAGKPVELGGDFATGQFGGGDFPSTSGAFPALLQAAEKYLGVKYRWGGKDPRTGLDCSGLVYVAFRDVGIKAPLSSFTQSHWSQVKRITKAQAQAGDLVYWSTVPGHIGIVSGTDKMINAPHTGAVVRFDTISGHSSTVTPLFFRYVGLHGTTTSSTTLGAAGAGRP